MIKQIAFLTAKPRMNRDAFVRSYEDGHVPLICEAVPLFEEYRRSYLVKENASMPGHLTAPPPSVIFDVVTELWFSGPDKIAEMTRLVHQTDAGERFATDESALFDRRRMVMCEVDERVTDTVLLDPPPLTQKAMPTIKMICFISRRPGTSREDFIDYYENKHVPLALRLLVKDGSPLFARYSRNFILADRQFQIGEKDASPPPLNFDVLTSIWFWSANDHKRFLALFADKSFGAQLEEDEARFMDRNKVNILMAQEFGTRLNALPVGTLG